MPPTTVSTFLPCQDCPRQQNRPLQVLQRQNPGEMLFSEVTRAGVCQKDQGVSLGSGGLDLYRWANPPCTLHSQGEPAISGLCVRRCGQQEGEARIPRGIAAPGNYPTMIYCRNSPGSSRFRGGSCKWVNRKEI